MADDDIRSRRLGAYLPFDYYRNYPLFEWDAGGVRRTMEGGQERTLNAKRRGMDVKKKFRRPIIVQNCRA